jgi:hypothetical protein
VTRPTFDRLVHLRKRAHSLRIGLLARLSEYASDFPSGTPKEIIDLIKRILVGAAEQIESSIDTRFLEQTCREIQALGSLLSFFDNAHTAQTPRGLIEVVDQLMARLQPDSQLMVWPQAEFNYSIRDLLPPLKSSTQYFLPANVFKEVFGRFNGALNLVSFPRIERDNVLLHATLGHELGHPIADKFLANEKGTKQYSEGLHRAVQRLTGPVGDAGTELDATLDTLTPDITRLLKLRTRGLQELVSDCVGTLLFGFSAIFAAYDVLTVNGMDALPDNRFMYPPRRFRLRIQHKIANNTGHFEAIKSLRRVDRAILGSARNFMDHLEGLISEEHDLAKLKTDRVIEIAYDWIDETLDEAVEFAVKEVGDLAFEVKKVQDEVPELIKRIDLGLPPNEIGRPPNARPVDWRSAILAAWLYRLHGKKLTGGDSGKLMTATDFDNLNRLTLKAVEYTTIQKQYADYRTSS